MCLQNKQADLLPGPRPVPTWRGGPGARVPALRGALAGQADHSAPFVGRGSSAHSAPAHFLLGADGGAGLGPYVPGTKGPFVPTRHHLLSSGPSVVAAPSGGGRRPGLGVLRGQRDGG